MLEHESKQRRVMSAHQPTYLPYAGLWWKYMQADVFVWLDSVQYTKNGWQNRNRVRNAEAWQWLTVPVYANMTTKIMDVTVAGPLWPEKHRKTLELLYGRTAHKERLKDLLDLYRRFRMGDSLCTVIRGTNAYVRKFFSTQPMEVWSSEYVLPENPDDRLIALCRMYGCDVYLSGPDGALYMDREKWEASGIEVWFSAMVMPEHAQLYPGWESNLSIVDTIMNVKDVEGFVRTCGCIADTWKRKGEKQ